MSVLGLMTTKDPEVGGNAGWPQMHSGQGYSDVGAIMADRSSR